MFLSQTEWQPYLGRSPLFFGERACYVQRLSFRPNSDLAVRALVSGLQSRPARPEEMMAERGLNVDHSTVHRWVVHFSPQLLERFNGRKRAVTGKWHMDETYIKIRGQWMYLSRRRRRRRHGRVLLQRTPRPAGSQALLPEGPWSATADRIASSSTAARPIMRRSFPATPNTVCGIDRDER
ncbi:hypothetical protein BQ8482_290020 [Mesorhizobium delmotii]|uniref:DDE domain-containing protein n=2 Tax=Mesorhizobium TaxID=68287 RepID=A0A2P9AMP1_9HYPH|nr:hypothetical protein BQ8482_290020 [Mesorhizobium delmotii]